MRLDHELLRCPEADILKYYEYIYLAGRNTCMSKHFLLANIVNSLLITSNQAFSEWDFQSINLSIFNELYYSNAIGEVLLDSSNKYNTHSAK